MAKKKFINRLVVLVTCHDLEGNTFNKGDVVEEADMVNVFGADVVTHWLDKGILEVDDGTRQG